MQICPIDYNQLGFLRHNNWQL